MIKIILQYLLLLIAVKLVFLGVIYLCLDQQWIELPSNVSKLEIQQHSMLYMIVVIVVIGPILEETMFRLSLIFKPLYMSLSCAILFLYLYSFYTGVALDSWDFWITRAGLCTVVFLFVYGVTARYANFFTAFWKKNSYTKIFLASFLFGVFHLMNYPSDSLSWLNSTILVLPYFASGLIYSHLRLTYAFRWTVVVHVLFNGMGLLLTSIFSPGAV